MNYWQRTRSRVHRLSRRSKLFKPFQPWLSAVVASRSIPLSPHPPISRLFSWKLMGICLGVLMFCGITTHADPASAQLFSTVESQVKSIFGSNIDESIISFMFGVLRIVIWVTSVGFILFAVYQAQRGEQWQPLMQNAFIVVAAVVVVEGVSKLFFGGTAAGT